MNLAKEIEKSNGSYEIFTFAYFPSETYDEFKKLKVNAVFNLSKDDLLAKILRFLNINLGSFYLYLAFLLKFKFINQFKNKNFDILNPHDWFSTWIAVDVKNKYLNNSKMVVMLNDMPPCAVKKRTFKNFIEYQKDKKIHRHIDSIMVLDGIMRRKAQSYYKNVKINVVRSGIDLEKYKNFIFDRAKYRAKLNINEDAKLFVCASVPNPRRRFEDVIKALNQINNKKLKLLIIGDLSHNPKYGEKLKNLVKTFGLEERVTFVSKFLPFDERGSYIASSDVFIFPNEEQTWGLAVIEAMALGVPCIVSNGAGVHEVLTDGENALIYEVGNIIELKEKMIHILQNKKAYNRIKRNGQNLVFENFSWEKYKNQVYSVFLSVISEDLSAPKKFNV